MHILSVILKDNWHFENACYREGVKSDLQVDQRTQFATVNDNRNWQTYLDRQGRNEYVTLASQIVVVPLSKALNGDCLGLVASGEHF